MENDRQAHQEKYHQTITELQHIGKRRLETGWNVNEHFKRAYHYTIYNDAQQLYDEMTKSSLAEILPSSDVYEFVRYKPFGIILTVDENSYGTTNPLPEFELEFQYGVSEVRFKQSLRVGIHIFARGIEVNSFIFDENHDEQGYEGEELKSTRADEEQQAKIVEILSSNIWRPLPIKR